MREASIHGPVVAGANKFTFSGRIGDKGLKPGRYKLEAAATDPNGNASAAVTDKFKIVK